MEIKETELTEKNLEQASGGYESVENLQSDAVNPVATKSWFGTADKSASHDDKISGFIGVKIE